MAENVVSVEIPGSPVYVYSANDVAGVLAANTFLSVFNPVGSGKVLGGLQVLIQPYSVGVTIAANSLALWRTTAASGGTLLNGASINRFNPIHPNPIAEVRINNPSVTTTTLPVGGTAPTVSDKAGSSSAITVSSGGASPLLIYPGTGVAFRTDAGDVDQRWTYSFFWTEL